MEVRVASIPGLIVIEPKVHGDERGLFMESYSRDRYAEAGLPREFVQDNISVSARGTLRGLFGSKAWITDHSKSVKSKRAISNFLLG